MSSSQDLFQPFEDGGPGYPRGEGLRVRLERIPGVTAKRVLQEKMYLPVVLGDFAVGEEFLHRDYETIRGGEFSVRGPGPESARRLRPVDLETLTLDWHAPWLIEYRDPQEIRRELSAIGRARTPFEIVAILEWGGGPEELRMFATMRSLTRILKPGETDTRYMSLGLKEWRDGSVTRRGGGGGKKDKLPMTVRLKAEDTLEGLARTHHGTVSTWRGIASDNGIPNWGQKTPLIQSSRYKVGSKFKIPAVTMVGRNVYVTSRGRR